MPVNNFLQNADSVCRIDNVAAVLLSPPTGAAPGTTKGDRILVGDSALPSTATGTPTGDYVGHLGQIGIADGVGGWTWEPQKNYPAEQLLISESDLKIYLYKKAAPGTGKFILMGRSYNFVDTFSVSLFRTDIAYKDHFPGDNVVFTASRFDENAGNYMEVDILVNGFFKCPSAGRYMVNSKWWNRISLDQRMALEHLDSSENVIRSWPGHLSSTAYKSDTKVLDMNKGDLLRWKAEVKSNALFSEHRSEMIVTKL